MRTAAEWVRKNLGVLSEPELRRLLELLRVECKAATGEALDDCRAAVTAGMYRAAEVTFMASFRLAGIRAAKALRQPDPGLLRQRRDFRKSCRVED